MMRRSVDYPVLHTARLLLVPLADRHFEFQVELDSDPAVQRYITGRARTRSEVAAWHADRLARARDGLGHWMAFCGTGGGGGPAAPADESRGEFVGLMIMRPARGPDMPDDPVVAELGYRLSRRYWRQGLATEASRELLRHAFDTVGQDRVLAHAMMANVGSWSVMRTIGMRYVRTFVPSVDEPTPGAEQGDVEYEMTRETWAAVRGVR